MNKVIFLFFLGLPTKARGKYRKRRFLPEEDKEKMMRDQNRDNARRTRKRKKLYDFFLGKALRELEIILGPDSIPEEIEYSDIITKPNQQKNRKLKKLHENEESSSLSSTQVTNGMNGHKFDKEIIDKRLDIIRRFIVMRVSCSPKDEKWTTVCDLQITHQMPYPSYRETNHTGTRSDVYDVRGIPGLIEDTENRARFFSSVIYIYILQLFFI